MSTPIPSLPEHLKRHYVILAPLGTHWRPATCQEVECARWRDGFEVILTNGPDQAERAAYVRGDKTRTKTEWQRLDGTIVFRFPPETPTYAGGGEHDNHRIRIDRPELFGVKDSDGARLHQGREGGAVDWVDEFANHQDKLATARERG